MPFYHVGDAANIDLDPQPMVHHVGCQAIAGPVLPGGRTNYPFAVACPVCFDGTGLSQGPVIFEQRTYVQHDYTPGMAWPGNVKRELCRVCHGTHADELAAIDFYRP